MDAKISSGGGERLNNQVLFYGGIAGICTIVGAGIPLLRKNLDKLKIQRLMTLGAGFLLGASFLHIIPDALTAEGLHLSLPPGETGEVFSHFHPHAGIMGGIGLVVAFILIFGIEQFCLIHTCREYDEECLIHRMGMAAFFALFLHSLIDGLAIASGFTYSRNLGLVASMAVIIHEVPEGLCTSSLLLGSGYSRRQSLLFSLLVAIATPLGAMLTSYGLKEISGAWLSLVLGICAGSFIYIGASDILPRVHRTRDSLTLGFFALGITLTLVPLLF